MKHYNLLLRWEDNVTTKENKVRQRLQRQWNLNQLNPKVVKDKSLS